MVGVPSDAPIRERVPSQSTVQKSIPPKVNMDELRAKIASIVEKPAPKQKRREVVYRPQPRGVQAPPPDKFFEEETVTND